MWIHDMMHSIKLFIVLNPFETAFLLVVVCTWTGSYLESVFKFWDWGPQCQACKEWHIYSDSVILCTKCDEYRCNDEWKAGYDVDRGGDYPR